MQSPVIYISLALAVGVAVGVMIQNGFETPDLAVTTSINNTATIAGDGNSVDEFDSARFVADIAELDLAAASGACPERPRGRARPAARAAVVDVRGQIEALVGGSVTVVVELVAPLRRAPGIDRNPGFAVARRAVRCGAVRPRIAPGVDRSPVRDLAAQAVRIDAAPEARHGGS